MEIKKIFKKIIVMFITNNFPVVLSTKVFDWIEMAICE